MSNKIVSLALQGGGSHGAFTWGVLDRLLEDGRLDLEGISGASAGAMNAAVMAQGYVQDGRDGARAALERFWTALSTGAPLDYINAEGAPVIANPTPMPGMQALLAMTRFFSPTQLNPLDINPLRDILADTLRYRVDARAQPLAKHGHALERIQLRFETDRRRICQVVADGVLGTHDLRGPGHRYVDGTVHGGPLVNARPR